MKSSEKIVEQIASVCHEANRQYCRTLGDGSQEDWANAPEWQRESAIKGVRAHLNNPHLTPEQSHELWLDEKRNTGWKYGPVKNAITKEHPCFKPYGELPVSQRIKDSIFKSVVGAMAPLDE